MLFRDGKGYIILWSIPSHLESGLPSGQEICFSSKHSHDPDLSTRLFTGFWATCDPFMNIKIFFQAVMR